MNNATYQAEITELPTANNGYKFCIKGGPHGQLWLTSRETKGTNLCVGDKGILKFVTSASCGFWMFNK
jgi:hypothetical protein